MNIKTLKIIIIICVLTSAQFCQALANSKADNIAEDCALRIYLPREVAIEDDTISLGQVSIVRGEESLVAKASGIALGRMSVPGQRIIIDRTTVLSRLVCSGIALANVRLTGAEKIKVRQQQRIIKGSEFVELASSFLKKSPLDRSVCQLDPIWRPKDLVIPDSSKDIRLFPSLLRSGARSRAKVQISVLADGRKIGAREVTFRLRYNHRRVVTLVDIPAGGSISANNVKIEKDLSNYPEPANWNLPYGLIARRRIPANTTLRSYMVSPASPAVFVKRNQTVVIQIKSPGLLITAVGKALQSGQSGEYIKVKNVDSQRIIFARVSDDGTVEPVF
jgi:flagella basal body P-ring formation protein FlgA